MEENVLEIQVRENAGQLCFKKWNAKNKVIAYGR